MQMVHPMTRRRGGCPARTGVGRRGLRFAAAMSSAFVLCGGRSRVLRGGLGARSGVVARVDVGDALDDVEAEEEGDVEAAAGAAGMWMGVRAETCIGDGEKRDDGELRDGVTIGQLKYSPE